MTEPTLPLIFWDPILDTPINFDMLVETFRFSVLFWPRAGETDGSDLGMFS